MEWKDCECYTSQMEYDRGEINSLLQGGKAAGMENDGFEESEFNPAENTQVYSSSG